MNGDSADPVIDPKDAWLSKLFHGQHFELPETAAPPMEAIYNDGSHEGYLESLLCELFLSAIPYTRFEKDHWHIIMTQPPADLEQKWENGLCFSAGAVLFHKLLILVGMILIPCPNVKSRLGNHFNLLWSKLQ